MQIEANGLNFEVDRAGDGATVTLIHGIASGLESWDEIAGILRQSFDVVRLDLRGHGKSDVPPGPYSIEGFAEDVHAVLMQLGIKKSHIAGFSLGGLIAQAFALNYPDCLDKLVILSAVANKSPETLARLKQRADEIDKHGGSSAIEAALERWFTPEFRQARPDLVDQRVERYLSIDQKAYARAYRTFAEGDLGDQLHRITAPTLVMTGEHDPGSSAEMARFMHAQIAGSKLHIIPRLRHNILLEGAEIVAERITEFL